MTFEKALKAIREGKKVKRQSDDFSIEYVKDDDEIWCIGGQMNNQPFYCASDSILANDWEIVNE